MDGYLVYYNYFKPNEALNGKTPAEAAKVDYQIKNWKDLCQLPFSKRTKIQSYKPLRLASHKLPRISPAMPRISKRMVKLE
jgi:hypothetical protein